MATQVAIEDLSTWLSNQPDNTVDTPYEIEITGLTESNYYSIKTALSSNNTKYVDLKTTILPQVENLANVFDNCRALVKAPAIPSSITTMIQAFKGCRALVEAPEIPYGVIRMKGAFQTCMSLTEAPEIPSSVTELESTFDNCRALINVPIIPNSVTNLNATFKDCTALQELKINFSNFGNITNYFNIFMGCNNLISFKSDSPYELKSWLTTIHNERVDNFPNDPTACNYNLLSNPAEISINNLSNELATLSVNTVGTPYNITITDLTSSNITNIRNALTTNNTKYVDLHTTELPSGITSLEGAFLYCTSLVYAPIIPDGVRNMMNTFSDCTALKESPLIPDSVIFLSECFFNCSSLTSVTLPKNVTSLSATFYRCTSLVSAPKIPESAVLLEATFFECTNLTDISFEKYNFSNVSNYSYLFKGCTALETCHTDRPYELKSWLSTIYNASTDNIPINPDNLVYNFINIPTEIPVSSLSNELSVVPANTISTPYNIAVTELDSTNYNTIKTNLIANNTKYVDLHTTELPNVTNLDNTFENCTTLIKAPDNPSSVTSMQSTYSGCTNLSEVPEIPYTVTSLVGLLNSCSSITEAPELPSVTSYQNVFNGCSNLEDISNLDLTGATNLQNTFKDCTSLVDAPTIPNTVTNMEGTFNGCSALENTPRIPSSVTNMESTFEGCSSLTAVQNVPANVTNLTETFKNCSALEEIDLFEVPLSVLSTNAADCFSGCTSLTNVAVNGAEPSESSQWHIFFLTFGEDTVSGKVYSKNGNQIVTQTISPITIDKSILTLPVITDELWFPDGTYIDSDIESIIQRMITYQYGYFNSAVIPVDRKSFVLWADNKQNIITNFDSGGGTDIEVYPSEQAIIDDLPNLEIGDIVASDDPNENETIAILMAKIQELEEIGTVYKTDIHDFGSNPTGWAVGNFNFTFEETVPVGKYRVNAIIPNESNGNAQWCIMIHSGDVSTSYEGITNWTTGWDVLIGNYASGNLEGSGVIAGTNHKGTIIDCGVMNIKTPLINLTVGATTVANISSPNKVQIVLERIA